MTPTDRDKAASEALARAMYKAWPATDHDSEIEVGVHGWSRNNTPAAVGPQSARERIAW